MSTFSWLDHSERERRRVLDAIDKFSENDTRDELGLASIRDGFADHFFPGTGTLQTRIRYFLFTPWIYRRLACRASSARIDDRARRDELKLGQALLAAPDNDGVFGKRAGATLKRLPSNVYWNGLGMWKIRCFHGSQSDYHREFDRLQAKASRGGVRDDDQDLVDDQSSTGWHAHLPPMPEGFPDQATFDLTVDEAQYLVDRIVFAAPRSLLAHLVRRATDADSDYAWAHPGFAEFPSELRNDLEHARLLAETMHGAAFVYNLLLAEELPPGPTRDKLVELYRQAIHDWSNELATRDQAIRSWNRPEFWVLVRRLARVSTTTEHFVEAWLARRPWEDAAATIDGPHSRMLMRDRERALKGARARLGNVRALELWGGSSGTGRIEYRWRSARRLLRDLYAGLAAEESNA